MQILIKRILATTFLAGASVATAHAADKVFFLLPNTTTIRFESRDAPFFVEAMKEKAPDAEVIVQNAQGDPQQQQRQIEDAIAQGAKPDPADLGRRQPDRRRSGRRRGGRRAGRALRPRRRRRQGRGARRLRLARRSVRRRASAPPS